MNRDRKNYLAHTLEGGLFVGGVSFVATDKVLTVMAKQLDAPVWLISLLPSMMFLGMIMAPIFTASFIERSRRMMPICLITGIPQRLFYLIAGLIVIFFGESHPMWALTAMVLAPLLSGLSGGVGQGAWVTLVARTVPPNRRSSLSANRNLIAAGIGLGAGFLIKFVLDHYQGTAGFGLLHLIAFAFLAASYLCFMRIEEPESSTPPRKDRSIREFAAELVEILRVDKNFRNFALMRFFGPAGSFVVPFATIYAISKLNASDGFVGDALVAATLGQISGNLIAGYFGDKFGGKILLIAARICFLGGFAMIAFAESEFAFMAYFFLETFGRFVNIIGNTTLMMEIAPDDRRPTYGALSGLLNGPSMIVFALIGGVFWQKFDSMHIQAAIAAAGMLASLYFILLVREPRKLSSI